MGNTLCAGCVPIYSGSLAIKLFLYDGTTRLLQGKRLAAEIMFEFPDCMICHADSFFLGQPIPALDFDAELINGETYFVLPLDCFPCRVFSASSLVALGSGPERSAVVNFAERQPFEYVKGSDGKVLIKVIPEFMIMLMTRGKESGGESAVAVAAATTPHGVEILCSTPELKKHYDHLVGSKDQVWSPKLETISESKARYSPWRCIGLERHHREGEG